MAPGSLSSARAAHAELQRTSSNRGLGDLSLARSRQQWGVLQVRMMRRRRALLQRRRALLRRRRGVPRHAGREAVACRAGGASESGVGGHAVVIDGARRAARGPAIIIQHHGTWIMQIIGLG
jgi:hypothetical protein